jgi:hypothetical protein
MYCSPSITRMTQPRGMTLAGHVPRMGEEECMYTHDTGGKSRGERPLGKPRRR